MGARAKSLRTSKGTRQRFFRPPCTHVDKACALTFSLSVLTRRCAVGHLKEQFSRGESGTPTKTCRDPGSNWGPPDLRSDALPTELSRRCQSRKQHCRFFWTKSLPKDMLVDVTQRCFSPSNLLRTLARTLCLSGRNPNVRESFDSPEKNYPRVIFSLLRVMIMSGN